LVDFQFEEIKNSEKTILGNFSQYHLNTVDIEKKFSFFRIQYFTECYLSNSNNETFIFTIGVLLLILRLFSY